MRYLFVTLLSLGSLSLFASGEVTSAKSSVSPCCNQPAKPENKQQCCNPPAKSEAKQPCPANLRNKICLYETFDNDGVNLGARGDLLYMIYNSPVLTYASEQTVTNEVLYSKILSVPGKLSLGCDVALLYTMPNQPGYSFEFGWYHIVAKFSRDVDAPNLVPAHSVALTNSVPGSASINDHMAINFFNLMVKKDFSLGNWVSMTPAAGLIGGYMDSKSTAHFLATSGNFGVTAFPNTSTAATLAYTTKFEGIGMKIGGCSAFKIWKGLRFKADLFYSALYGLSRANLNYSQNGTISFHGATLAGTNVKYSQHHGRTIFDSLLALAWENRFSNDSLYLDVHVGWRFQSFSDGWKEFEAELDDSMHELSLLGQGLQAGVTFKF